MVTHTNFLAWKIPWRKKPGGLHCMGLQRVREDWAHMHTSNLGSDWKLFSFFSHISSCCSSRRPTVFFVCLFCFYASFKYDCLLCGKWCASFSPSTTCNFFPVAWNKELPYFLGSRESGPWGIIFLFVINNLFLKCPLVWRSKEYHRRLWKLKEKITLKAL